MFDWKRSFVYMFFLSQLNGLTPLYRSSDDWFNVSNVAEVLPAPRESRLRLHGVVDTRTSREQEKSDPLLSLTFLSVSVTVISSSSPTSTVVSVTVVTVE